MSTLRIRPDNGAIRELNIPKEVLEVLQKVVSSNVMDKTKHATIRKLTNGSPCCVCTNGIPAYEVIYQLENIEKIERYCESCVNRVFSRNAVT